MEIAGGRRSLSLGLSLRKRRYGRGIGMSLFRFPAASRALVLLTGMKRGPTGHRAGHEASQVTHDSAHSTPYAGSLDGSVAAISLVCVTPVRFRRENTCFLVPCLPQQILEALVRLRSPSPM